MGTIHSDGTIIQFFTKGNFHLSELTGQSLPIVMRISLLIKTSSQILNIMHEGDGFSAKALWKKLISFAN